MSLSPTLSSSLCSRSWQRKKIQSEVVKLLFAHKILLAQYAIVVWVQKLFRRHKMIFTFVSLFGDGKYDFFRMIKNCIFMFFSLALSLHATEIFIDVDTKRSLLCKQNIVQHAEATLSARFSSQLAFHPVPFAALSFVDGKPFRRFPLRMAFDSVISRHEPDVDSCCNPFVGISLRSARELISRSICSSCQPKSLVDFQLKWDNKSAKTI